MGTLTCAPPPPVRAAPGHSRPALQPAVPTPLPPRCGALPRPSRSAAPPPSATLQGAGQGQLQERRAGFLRRPRAQQRHCPAASTHDSAARAPGSARPAAGGAGARALYPGCPLAWGSLGGGPATWSLPAGPARVPAGHYPFTGSCVCHIPTSQVRAPGWRRGSDPGTGPSGPRMARGARQSPPCPMQTHLLHVGREQTPRLRGLRGAGPPPPTLGSQPAKRGALHVEPGLGSVSVGTNTDGGGGDSGGGG